MVPVALPSIVDRFGTRLSYGIWLVSIYVLLVAVFMPIFGWLGDRFGYRRIYLAGLCGYVLSSWAAVFAPSFGWLMVCRVLQGICNATTLPSVMGIISQIFPGRQRGKAMGIWATVNGAAHGLGPVISGLVIQSFDWRALFGLNGSIALIGVMMVLRVVPPDRTQPSRPFDWWGAATLTFAMLSLMVNLTQVKQTGWTSKISIGLWAAFLVLTAIFLLTESRVAHPFVRLQLFANKAYAFVVAVSGAQFFCLMGLQISLPLYLINLRGFSAAPAGLTIAAFPATLALVSPFAGQFADQRGHWYALKLGMTTVVLATATLVTWGPHVPVWLVVLTLIVIGLGMAFVQSPGAAGVTLSVAKQELGVALGIFNMLRFISATLGATICGVILAWTRLDAEASLSAFRGCFGLLTAVAGAGALTAFYAPPSKSVR